MIDLWKDLNFRYVAKNDTSLARLDDRGWFTVMPLMLPSVTHINFANDIRAYLYKKLNIEASLMIYRPQMFNRWLNLSGLWPNIECIGKANI